MEKSVAILAKAVTTTAAIGFLLAAMIVVDTRNLVALPFLALTLVAGGYAWRVARAGQTVAAAEPELKQRILVT